MDTGVVGDVDQSDRADENTPSAEKDISDERDTFSDISLFSRRASAILGRMRRPRFGGCATGSVSISWVGGPIGRPNSSADDGRRM